ncbi:hypothetical protein H072_7157 [Dactylellina haptotyla CBS 200.50]|uniref:Uncharacterized protein n=1 Tax=Dactylellina haptotyla (strain CBS 200.50) TaxID=1284197 RepID=S8BIE6_DACHA|nr:hypothetical protein H072_7157 [Dactylellina haptotyla CBS 200.50]
MRSELLILAGLSGLASSRYLPPDASSNHGALVRRQMESTGGGGTGRNNPFLPMPAQLNIDIGENEAADNGGEDGQGTPRFTGSDDSGEADSGDNIPAFAGTGLGTALDRLDLSQLQQQSPNAILPADTTSEIQGGGQNVVSEQIQVSEDIIERPEPNGEPVYADFDVDQTEPDWAAFPWLRRNPYWGVPPQAQVSVPSGPQRIRRPADQPKRDKNGRRMGWILNEMEWLPDGTTRPVHPFWGVIEPGHEVAEDLDYMDDDTPPASEASETGDINDRIRSLMFDNVVENIPAEAAQDGSHGSQESQSGSVYSDEEGRDRFYSLSAPTLEQEILMNQAAAEAEAYRRQTTQAALQNIDENDEFVVDSQEREDSIISSNGAAVGESSDEFIENVLETAGDISLNELPEQPASGINIAASIDPKYVEKQIASLNELSKPRRPRIAEVIEEQKNTAAPQLGNQQAASEKDIWYSDVPMDLIQTYGGYTGTKVAPEDAQNKPKGRISRFASYLTSIPKKAGRTVIDTVRGRSRNKPSTPQANTNAAPSRDSSPWGPYNDHPVTTDRYNAPLIDFGEVEEDIDKGRGRLPVG